MREQMDGRHAGGAVALRCVWIVMFLCLRMVSFENWVDQG
jgi:hypothetical protein